MELIALIFFVLITAKTITCLLPKSSMISQLCDENNVEINKCVQQILTSAMKIIKNDKQVFDPEIINPLNAVRHLYVVDSGEIATNYTNIVVSGLIGGLEISNFFVDLDKLLIKFDTLSPSVVFSSHYKLDGERLLVHVWGEGQCTFRIGQLKASHTITAEIINVADEDYLTIRNYVVALDTNDVTIQLDNLFDGSKIKSFLVEQYISSNSMKLYNDVEYLFEQFFAEEFKNIANGSLKKITFEDIFSSKNLNI